MTLEQANQAAEILEQINKLEISIRDVKSSKSIHFHGGFYAFHLDKTDTFESIKIFTILIITKKLDNLKEQLILL